MWARFSVIALVLLLSASTVEAEWLLFDLVDLGYQDRHGRPIADVAGRTNRFPGEAFYHAGYVYPSMTGINVTARHEHGGRLLISTDTAPATVDRFLVQSTVTTVTSGYRAQRRGRQIVRVPIVVREVSWREFNVRRISADRAAELLLEWFGISSKTDPKTGIKRVLTTRFRGDDERLIKAD